jgi:translation initiation factor IF-3
MRLAEEVGEIGQIESPPLLDGRNMVMVLAPTANAGAKTDAKAKDTQRSEEAVQSERGRKDPASPAPPNDSSGPPGEEPPREAEARAAGQASRA